ncbi:MAG: lipoate--protein ligase family protein [Natrialbaceae archaeon]|nr:lipoate--protein ligase family protein [Natrialbaceae archaeon]
MHVVRGRDADLEADREWTGRLLESAAGGTPGMRVWIPPRHVAFGRRDRTSRGYDRALEGARQRGFETYERQVGGRAVAFDGEATIAFLLARPIDDTTISDRFTVTLERVATAFESLGIETDRGEPDATVCPGSCSLSHGGRKLVGLAQRVTAEASLVAGLCLFESQPSLTACLEAVYEALGLPFDPDSIGGIDAPPEPATACQRLEAQLCPGEPTQITDLDGHPS